MDCNQLKEREDKWRERKRERERLTEVVELVVQGLHVTRRHVQERADSLSNGKAYKCCAAWREGERTQRYNSSPPPQCHCKEQCGSNPKKERERERERN